jgi:light-regulated signal transduction histidine kinase (bacteriophytochrome)
MCIALLLLSLTVATASAHRKLAQQARHLEQTVELRTAELRRREEEAQQANRVLQRANEDLRQFAWAASHDLQEPLRMVVAYTQFLARRYQDQLDETGNQFISFAVTGAQRMQTLLQGLLEYWQVSERTDDAIAAVDTQIALKKALDNLELVIVKSGAVVSHSPLPTLPANEAALIQVFQNLIGNAIKYRKANETPRIHIAAERLHNAEWRFSIQDNGIGIAPEHQNLIFKIFKRLNGNRYSGAGIGLAICVKIVEHLGGKLWVESEVGRGATFYFTVPDRKGSEWNIAARMNARL